MTRQYPRSKNVDEASAAKIQKAHGQVVAKMKELAKQYKAGNTSVVAQLKDLTAKKKELEKHLDAAVANIGKGQQLAEVTEDEVQDAIMDLRNLIDEVESLSDEAREIVRNVFPNELSRLDAYGAFNAMYSANRYDVTLGGFVDRLEEEGYEIDDEGNVETLEEWGGSDQHAMNQSMHKDLGNPDKFPGLSQVLAAAEAAVDFYWDDWEEYKTDREGLVTYAAQRYTSKMFPEFWNNMQKLFAPANEGYKGKHQGTNYQWPMSQATKDRKEADKFAGSDPKAGSTIKGRGFDWKKEQVNEMDGGQLFDYFKSKGYDITERRPDGYPAKEGVEGYQVSRGEGRAPQSVIFQHNKDTDEFTISRMSGYRIDEKEAVKAGMRQAGRSGVAGIDSYMTDGNYNPVDISAEGLKDIVDHVMSGLDREAKAQGDFYKDRGHTSGTIDEGATVKRKRSLKK
jgi:hypothetical protein